MKIVHFCAGLEKWNGMANTALQFVLEERAKGDDSQLTNKIDAIISNVDQVVIHGAWLPELWKVAKRAKAVGAKLVIRPAGSYDPVRLAYHGWKKRLVAPLEHRMLRRADVLLATCEAEVEWIKSYDSKVKSIALTDLKRFFDLPTDSSSLFSVPSFPPSVPRPLHLLYLGRSHPLKGLSYLETAIRQIEKNSAPLRLCVRIVSSAFGAELEKVWNWCDVLILPTLSENFGRVIAEALERGKRVITTDGAPAWSDGNDYGGRLTYLKGYRNGSPEQRIGLLYDALWKLNNEQ